MDYKNLGIRTVSGTVLVAVIVTAVLPMIDTTGWIFFGVFGLISLFATREFMIINGAEKTEALLAGLCSMMLFVWRWEKFNVSARNTIAIYGLLVLLMIVIYLLKDHLNMVERTKRLLTGQGYIAIPFAMMNDLRFEGEGILLFAVFVLIWVNDTFAYLTGSMIGKHRMIEKVSPKKSWEGFFGGMIFALGGAAVLWHFFSEIELWRWMVMGVVIVIFGTLGDLMESQMKRTLGIKDSGRAIPGHGGWLDRFDSVIIASIALNIIIIL